MEKKGVGVMVLVGKPRKGAPPPFPAMPGKRGGDPETKEVSKLDGGAPEEIDDLGKRAGFWNQSSPHTCDTCEYFVDEGDGTCRLGVKASYEDSDPSMSGCNLWEGHEEEEEEDDEEEEKEKE
jgi:hypothetical protein